jgi:broad specificity phosphatase PhoE
MALPLTVRLFAHIESENNLNGLIVGNVDEPPAELFRNAVYVAAPLFYHLLRDLLRERHASDSIAVACSPLQRSRESAQAVLRKLGFPLIVDERLSQMNYGPEFTLRPSTLLKGRRKEFVDQPMPGGESFKMFAERHRAFLDDTARGQHNVIIMPMWRYSAAVFAYLCNGLPLEQGIEEIETLPTTFTYRGALGEGRGVKV